MRPDIYFAKGRFYRESTVISIITIIINSMQHTCMRLCSRQIKISVSFAFHFCLYRSVFLLPTFSESSNLQNKFALFFFSLSVCFTMGNWRNDPMTNVRENEGNAKWTTTTKYKREEIKKNVRKIIVYAVEWVRRNI